MEKSKIVLKEEGVTKCFINFFPLCLFLIQLSGVLFMSTLIFMAVVYLHGFNFSYSKEKGKNLHVVLAPFAFIYLNGQAILLFRLLRNITTEVVKTFHTIFHTIALVLGILSIFTIWICKEYPYDEYTRFQQLNESVPHSPHYTPIPVIGVSHFSGLHNYLGCLSILCTFSVYVFGIYLHLSDLELSYKILFHGVHSTFGVCAFLISTLTGTTGIASTLNDEHYFEYGRHIEWESEYKVGLFCMTAMNAFTWFIVFVFLNRQFMWYPIGPI